MNILIERDSGFKDSQYGVFGKVYLDGVLFAHSCEQPWRNNEKGRSCIPAGDYELRIHNSAKYGRTVSFHNPELKVWAHEVPKGLVGREPALNDRTEPGVADAGEDFHCVYLWSV